MANWKTLPPQGNHVTRPQQGYLQTWGCTISSPNSYTTSRKAYWGAEHGFIDVPVMEIEDVGGKSIHGPVFFDTYDTTIVVPPYCTVKLSDNGNLLLDIEG